MPLETSLKRHRARLVLRTFIHGFALALSVSLTLTGLILVVNHLADWELEPLAVLLTALAAALAAALIHTLVRDTSLQRTARVLEAQDPTLHARLSTALELKRSGRSASPILRAQVSDATQHAQDLKPGEYIRLGLSKRLRTGLLASSAVLAAGTLLSGPLALQPTVVTTAPAVTDGALAQDEQAALASNIQQLADMFSETAETGEDSYLQAISRQLQDLGERLETSELTREQVSSELERLLQHTQTALELQGDNLPEMNLAELPELLEAALRDVNRQPLAELQPEGDLADILEPDTLEGGSAEAGGDQAQAGGESAGPSLEDMLQAGEQLETGDGSSQSAASQQARSSGSYFDNALDERAIAELNARAMDAAAQAAGEAIGASPESKEGASSMAGQGTDELFGSDDAARLNAERLEQMAVPEETDPEGRHVRIEVTPETEFTEVRMTPLGEMTWNRQLEAEVVREALSTDQRDVTARFHTPELDE